MLRENSIHGAPPDHSESSAFSVKAPTSSCSCRADGFQVFAGCDRAADLRVPLCAEAGPVLVHDVQVGGSADLLPQESRNLLRSGKARGEDEVADQKPTLSGYW